MKLSNKAYDILKVIAWIITPLVTFIGALCIIWGVPYAEQITATLAAIDTLLGSIVAHSNATYNAEKVDDDVA